MCVLPCTESAQTVILLTVQAAVAASECRPNFDSECGAGARTAEAVVAVGRARPYIMAVPRPRVIAWRY